jgi:hypothetical protein
MMSSSLLSVSPDWLTCFESPFTRLCLCDMSKKNAKRRYCTTVGAISGSTREAQLEPQGSASVPRKPSKQGLEQQLPPSNFEDGFALDTDERFLRSCF